MSDTPTPPPPPTNLPVAGPVEPEEPRAEFIALTPKEMTAAHAGLLSWAEAKSREVQTEVKELADEVALAKQNKWRSGGFERHKRMAERRLGFYQRVIEALRAGYIVIPNFEVDIFAIRTDKTKPHGKHEMGDQWSAPHFPQEAKELPAGEGKYVGPMAEQETRYGPSGEVDKQGQPIKKYFAWPTDFADVAFPVIVAKPQVMNATAQAMALKVFDQIGVTQEFVRGRRGDPVVVGKILNPRHNAPDLTFFIAWYLDPSRI
jgi:hypothetical protein